MFSASKDNTPNVWYTINGERLGTFDGHTGVVWCIDPKCMIFRLLILKSVNSFLIIGDSTKVATGSGDCTLCIWDCETGTRLDVVKTETSVRSVLFSYSGNLVLYSTDQQMNKPAELKVIDTRVPDDNDGITNVFSFTLPSKSKALSSLWGILDQSFICGMENGKLAKWDLRQPDDSLLETEPHTAQINDMQYNKDQTLFVSASKDNTAKLFDPFTLEPLKTYVTERPVNSASISPIFDHVAVGGGQEAMEVTRTASESGKFESRFFHLIFEVEFARLKGHFGPIQSLAFHPDGRSFATGAEDGYIRIQSFDESYFNFKMEYE